ncbi:MAG TPA: Rieske 2Fe-2S domain-containing protein [Chloroflexota bacterium]|jgi:5,5'-dehydrodivanillate O-demethylase
MLSPEENALLTQVGPGTPGGEMLRRYWWPIGFSQELGPRPQPVRILGEELVLFRDQSGTLGLLGRYCAHRSASLEYGRVEACGLRCCYHGWLFAPDGRCLEQPAEPIESTYHERVRQRAYAVQEDGGLIFAYLGPTPAPLLPRYDVLHREDGARVLRARGGYCNWLQTAENAVDMPHLPWLHASVYPDFAGRRATADWEYMPYGIRGTLRVAGIDEPKISYTIFPSHNRFAQAREGTTPSQCMIFRVPLDDRETRLFFVVFHPHDEPSRPLELKTEGLRMGTPGVFARVDDEWWGVASHDQDRVVQETQGVLVDRGEEHLGASDRGVILLRQMVHEAIDAVAAGHDPIGVNRDPTRDGILDFDARFHLMGALAETR